MKSLLKKISILVLIVMTILATIVAVQMLNAAPPDSLKLSAQDLDDEIRRSEQLIIMTQGRIDILKQLKAVAVEQSKIKHQPANDSTSTLDKNKKKK
jgi:hypothetical protein